MPLEHDIDRSALYVAFVQIDAKKVEASKKVVQLRYVYLLRLNSSLSLLQVAVLCCVVYNFLFAEYEISYIYLALRKRALYGQDVLRFILACTPLNF